MVEGGTAHGWERSMINLCVLGCPLPPYIKKQGGRCGRPGGGTLGGVLLPPVVGLPPFLVGLGEGGKEEVERKERGAPPPSPFPIRTRGGGVRGPALAASPLLH